MADTPIGPGTVLAGRFRLEDLLDETDGARFWRATDQTLARSVAVHVVPTPTTPAPARCSTAARTSATGHRRPPAAGARRRRARTAWSTSSTSGAPASPWTGCSPRGRSPPRRAAWVVKEVAEAIATAHRHGVAHGRLLPENVMVTEAGVGQADRVRRRRRARTRRPRPAPGHRRQPSSAHESDVINLGRACCTPRWSAGGPARRAPTVPGAPREHGRPLRPRQVRAGVPRPLDAICERVLNAEAAPARRADRDRPRDLTPRSATTSATPPARHSRLRADHRAPDATTCSAPRPRLPTQLRRRSSRRTRPDRCTEEPAAAQGPTGETPTGGRRPR